MEYPSSQHLEMFLRFIFLQFSNLEETHSHFLIQQLLV